MFWRIVGNVIAKLWAICCFALLIATPSLALAQDTVNCPWHSHYGRSVVENDQIRHICPCDRPHYVPKDGICVPHVEKPFLPGSPESRQTEQACQARGAIALRDLKRSPAPAGLKTYALQICEKYDLAVETTGGCLSTCGRDICDALTRSSADKNFDAIAKLLIAQASCN